MVNEFFTRGADLRGLRHPGYAGVPPGCPRGCNEDKSLVYLINSRRSLVQPGSTVLSWPTSSCFSPFFAALFSSCFSSSSTLLSFSFIPSIFIPFSWLGLSLSFPVPFAHSSPEHRGSNRERVFATVPEPTKKPVTYSLLILALSRPSDQSPAQGNQSGPVSLRLAKFVP